MKIISKKSIFILLLLVICLGGFVLRSTYAKFTSSYTTDDDIVSYRYVFDLDIENIDEYELISVSASSDYIFNIDITNSLDSTINYGVWYGMVSPTSEENITVAKLSNSANSTSDTIDSGETKTVSLIIRNETSSSIQVKVGVTNLSGKKIITKEVDLQPKLSQYIENLYEDGSNIIAVDIGGDASNPQVKLNSNQGIMLDNNGEYRYYGVEPDNYVWFNDELWRIISVSQVDDGNGNIEKRVKIIKNDILEDDNGVVGYSWDSSASDVNSGYGVNDWIQADSMDVLNNLYYNSTSGICYNGQSNASVNCSFVNTGFSDEAKNLTSDVVYNLGGSSLYEGLYADDYYTLERGDEVYSCSAYDGECPSATTWTGRIGLMYPSDYVYAADLSVCTKNGYNYGDTSCYENDWIYNGESQWTINPFLSSVPRYAYILHAYGYMDYGTLFYGNTLRPVVYLKSDVVVAGGSGTSTDPYEIDLS